MQLTSTPTNIAFNMASTAPQLEPDPFVVVEPETQDPGHNIIVQDDVVLAADSDDEFERNANEWVVSPPHPSEFVRPPPIRPIYYVVTIGEEAGIYDNIWAESFDIRRVSRLEQFAMRTFRDWDEAHAHYTREYDLNHVANASRTPPPPEPPRIAAPVTDPNARMARAQSAPPSMLSVGTRSFDRLQTAAQPASRLQCGSLSQCGSPGRPIYVPSTWPTPALVRHVSSHPVTAQQAIAQPVIAQPVVAQPTRLGYVCGLLPAILEQTDRPTGRRPMTQLHFDSLGRLVHPAASISEEVELPTVRKPQPFPFIPDPDFFTYPNPQPQQDPATTPVRPLSFPPSTSSESGEAIPETPILNNPSQQHRRFVNLSPHIHENSASTRGMTAVHDEADADSEEIEVVATTLFMNGVTPESSASSAAKRGPPVAPSSSKTVRATRKRDSPSTPTSKTIKPTKARKTTSTKKSRRAPESDPEEEGKYASLWADE